MFASLSVAIGCGRSSVPGPSAVVLITLDTTRPDALGCYGGQGVETPNLDRLAREGVRFECAITPVPLTLPAHTSLLTGSYPTYHGVRTNGTFRLGDDVPTLAERMKARGFATGAVVAVRVLDHSFGLNRGFDRYDDAVDARPSGRLANEVTDAAIAWLAHQPRDRRVFLWAHYYDPHSSYDPPSPYRERFAGSDRRRYDGEVAFMDREIGRLLEAVRGRGPSTLTIAVADHGEAFGEKKETSHGFFIYDTTTRVPLILQAPGFLPAGTSVRALVRTIDVVPTLAAIFDFPIGPEVQGESLLDLALGKGPTTPRSAYIESYLPRLDFGWSELTALRTNTSKFIHAPVCELYDLPSDPDEARNLAKDRADEARRADQALAAIIARTTSPAGRDLDANANDPATRANLAALGYLNGYHQKALKASQSTVDPKDKVTIFTRFTTALVALGSNQASEAVRLFEGLARDDPTNARVQESLARAYVATSDPAKAEVAFRRAAEINPFYDDAWDGLGGLLLGRGDFARAFDAYDHALASNSKNGGARYNRAYCLRRLGRRDEALADYAEAVKIDPRNVDGRWAFADLLVEARPPAKAELEDALRVVSAVAEATPGNLRAREVVALLLAKLGRARDAEATFRRLLVDAPDHASTLNELAWLLLTADDPSSRNPREALRLAERAAALDPKNASYLDTLERARRESSGH
ncbi:MAG: sulfatase-like hydrolase/transferase [Planctomycetes bacterium]|nr:sulfatase-like hydrolase/transferase [Planctomycetota bacterium]MBI3844259.1 sulfatase-like hydrolase/transferase [Planctomycetota bacterium]